MIFCRPPGKLGECLTLRVREDYSTSAESSAQGAVLGLEVLDACGRLSFEPARYACRHQGKEWSGPYEHRCMLPIAQSHLQFEFANIHGRPLYAKRFFSVWFTGIDCSHTFGLCMRREVAGPDGMC